MTPRDFRRLQRCRRTLEWLHASDAPRLADAAAALGYADPVMVSALAAGARLVRPLQDQFYGERSGTVRDPFGYDWMLGHEIEAVEPEEMQRRYERMMGPG